VALQRVEAAKADREVSTACGVVAFELEDARPGVSWHPDFEFAVFGSDALAADQKRRIAQ
jgi:hypothetical protein